MSEKRDQENEEDFLRCGVCRCTDIRMRISTDKDSVTFYYGQCVRCRYEGIATDSRVGAILQWNRLAKENKQEFDVEEQCKKKRKSRKTF